MDLPTSPGAANAGARPEGPPKPTPARANLEVGTDPRSGLVRRDTLMAICQNILSVRARPSVPELIARQRWSDWSIPASATPRSTRFGVV
jgi:hypothetical protein